MTSTTTGIGGVTSTRVGTRITMTHHRDIRADHHGMSRRHQPRGGIGIVRRVGGIQGMMKMRRIMHLRDVRIGTRTATASGTEIGTTTEGTELSETTSGGHETTMIAAIGPMDETVGGKGRGAGRRRRRGVGEIMRTSMNGIGSGGGRDGVASGIEIGMGGKRRISIPRRSWRRVRITGIRLSRLPDPFLGRLRRRICMSMPFV